MEKDVWWSTEEVEADAKRRAHPLSIAEADEVCRLGNLGDKDGMRAILAKYGLALIEAA